MDDITKELERRLGIILDRIERLAESATPQDAVKLKANQILLSKILPDKQHLEIGSIDPPLERIARILAGNMSSPIK